jgi:hypothetical protein
LLEDEPGATNINEQKIIAQMATTNSTAEQQNYNSSSRTQTDLLLFSVHLPAKFFDLMLMTGLR